MHTIKTKRYNESDTAIFQLETQSFALEGYTQVVFTIVITATSIY